jgi:hypothetical protein
MGEEETLSTFKAKPDFYGFEVIAGKLFVLYAEEDDFCSCLFPWADKWGSCQKCDKIVKKEE